MTIWMQWAIIDINDIGIREYLKLYRRKYPDYGFKSEVIHYSRNKRLIWRTRWPRGEE